MGYSVTSMFSVSPNDLHKYFVYYIPSRHPYYNLSVGWIDNWIYTNFYKIASSIGSTGVIISPPMGKGEFIYREAYFAGLGGVLDGVLEYDYFLHEPFPFLIITTDSLRLGTKLTNGFLVNLVSFKNEEELNQYFDKLIENIRSDNWEGIVDSFPEQTPAREPDSYGRWYDGWNELIELKPNFFGLGVNINRAIEMITELSKRTQ